MVIFLLRINPSHAQRDDTLDILRSVEGPIRVQAGCMACESYESTGETKAVVYLEQWESMDAIHRHVRSPLYARILAVMDMSITKPEVYFCETIQMNGLEFIASLRSQDIAQ